MDVRTASYYISLILTPCRPPAAKGPPPAQGSKQVPDGDPNALAGLAFVFTGELSAFSRDEITELAKRYGGCEYLSVRA